VGIFSFEPVHFIDKNNKAKGLFPSLISEIASRENWKINYIPASFSQCLDTLESGRIDLMPTIAFSPERAHKMSFSKESVVDIWGQVFSRPDGEIQSVLDLKNQPIGLRHAKKYELIGTSIHFSPFSVYFATKKGNNLDLLNTIDTYLAEWKKDTSSAYYHQLSVWLGGSFEHQMIPGWLIVSFLITVGVAILLVFFNRMLKSQVIKKTNDLKNSEKHYRELVENAGTIILRWDTDGRIIFVNQFGLNLFGHPHDEIIGTDILDFISPKTQFTRNNLMKMVENICITPEKFSLVETEHLIDRTKKIHIQWCNKPITDNDGNLKEILSVGTDITQRKHLEKHLMNAQKMEAIGTLAGGIAHDFNNILTVIMGNTELAYVNQKNAREIAGNLDKILGATHRAKELTGQILAFSRESNPEKKPVNLSDITTEVLNMIRSTLPSTIKINSTVSSKKSILANPIQIHQVILNLCTNAFHAMEETGGELAVNIQEISFDSDILYPDGIHIPAGDYLILQISDTGPGIAPEIITKIFEPYFTTKEKGKGTGMGLAVVHGIIQDHKGYIRVKSEQNKGTDFLIYLPIAMGMNIPEPVVPAKKIQGGTEKILIVDDEKSIVEAMAAIVGNIGYIPSKFTSSLMALEEIRKNPDFYDLVITDMTMPDMTGLQLSREILAIRPDIPIIICTGYTDLITKEKAISIGASEYLQKPILRNDLLGCIRKVLDQTVST